MHALICRECGETYAECRIATCGRLESHKFGLCPKCLIEVLDAVRKERQEAEQAR